ncbi:hypothetical protein CLOP_g12597 [Closterium sp. NIES-67]|nr:hypothetical protein CLOP_g12597 [Closterium sp. NIES-67]
MADSAQPPSNSGVTSFEAPQAEDRQKGATVHVPEVEDGSVRADEQTNDKKEGFTELEVVAESTVEAGLESKQPSTSASSSKSSSGEGKNKSQGKGGRLALEQIRRVVDDPEVPADEKIKILHSKIMAQAREAKAGDKESVALQKKIDQLIKERDSVMAELRKSVTLRGKLETLCRELQKQNKTILEESKKAANEQQQKREELSSKFLDSIKDIETRLEEQGAERSSHLKENQILAEQLKKIQEHADVKEKYWAHLIKTKDLEYQLLDAKYKQQEKLMVEERALSKARGEQVKELLKTEKDLRGQLSLYIEKFDQFQGTLSKSNEVLSTMKKEMDKMTKRMKKLEKDNSDLRTKSEKSDVSLIELLDERAAQRKQLDTVQAQKQKLEGLCRSLQAERKKWLEQAQEQQRQAQENVNVQESMADAAEETDRRSSDGATAELPASELGKSNSTDAQQAAADIQPPIVEETGAAVST